MGDDRTIKLEAKLELSKMPEPVDLVGIHNQGQLVGMVSPDKIPQDVLDHLEAGKIVDLIFNSMVRLDQIDWATGELKS
jgi:hypothetical protein